MQDFQLTEHGESVSVSFIRDEHHLEKLCSYWLTKEAIAVDTEFDRTNTYFHNLALIQIFDGEQVWFIDPLELEQLQALEQVFASENLIKIFHSCSEDIEALFNRYQFVFNSIFDTQIAAGFAGMGLSLGYLRMVELISGISLDKEQTKTDWIKRPLADEQLVYAAQDVQFLLPAYFKLRDQLLEKGTFSYVIQDAQSMFEAVSSPENFDDYYLRIKGTFRLSAKQTNRLQQVASWREQLARLKNIPRTFIFRDHHLLELCQVESPRMSDLLTIGCHRASIRRYGAVLLALIEKSDKISPELWPEPSKAFHKITKAKQLAQTLKSAAHQVANEHSIPNDALINKRLIEYYIMISMKLNVRPNRFWNHWRKDLLAETFKNLMV